VPFQAPGAPESVGVTEAQCHDAVQWQGADGVRLSGAAAANAALASALSCSVPMVLYRFTSRAQERAYCWVATNRSRLPGIRPYCDEFPDECGGAAPPADDTSTMRGGCSATGPACR
jgi:hypothetical protein